MHLADVQAQVAAYVVTQPIRVDERTAFIRRILLDETEPVEAPKGETAAT